MKISGNFATLITSEMVKLIVSGTNEEGFRKKGENKQPTNDDEIFLLGPYTID